MFKLSILNIMDNYIQNTYKDRITIFQLNNYRLYYVFKNESVQMIKVEDSTIHYGLCNPMTKESFDIINNVLNLIKMSIMSIDYNNHKEYLIRYPEYKNQTDLNIKSKLGPLNYSSVPNYFEDLVDYNLIKVLPVNYEIIDDSDLNDDNKLTLNLTSNILSDSCVNIQFKDLNMPHTPDSYNQNNLNWRYKSVSITPIYNDTDDKLLEVNLRNAMTNLLSLVG